MEKLRLDRFLSSQLNITRTEAKKLLKSGVVTVNGTVVKKAETSVTAGEDTVAVYGKATEYKKHIYIMQHKPAGVVSASASPSDVTVVDILPEELKRAGLFPAGRLDKDTTGFVLITDDGEFAHDILSPAHHVPKTYFVTLDRKVTEEETALFTEGMTVGEERFKPAALTFLRSEEASGMQIYSIVITEGRYHQIKRMFASTGNPVRALHRVKIGGLPLDEALKPGESREITAEEFGLITEK